MNFMLERAGNTTFKKTRIIDDAVPCAIGEVSRALQSVPAGKLAIVADFAVGAAHGIDAVSRIAAALAADIYAAPFHVRGAVDPLDPSFRGQLPPTTKEINETLSRYHTMMLIGEKVDTFTYDGLCAIPSELQVIQIAPAASQLGFDYPCDIAVLGDIKATLDALATALGAPAASAGGRTVDVPTLEGPVTLTIPPGTSSHSKLRIKARGIERGNEKGDQFVVLKIIVPKSLDDEDKATIKKLQEKHPINPRADLSW